MGCSLLCRLCAAVCDLFSLQGIDTPSAEKCRKQPSLRWFFEDEIGFPPKVKRLRWEKGAHRNGRVFALLGGNERYGACADAKQDKDMAPLPTLISFTTARSAGSFKVEAPLKTKNAYYPRHNGDGDSSSAERKNRSERLHLPIADRRPYLTG